MELTHQQSLPSEHTGHKWPYKIFLALLLAGLVTIASTTALHAQKAPKAAPQVEPTEPPEPPEPPEAPEPPEPPDAPDQVYILNDGSVHLGVALLDVTADKARELKLPTVSGALVENVQNDTAAAKAGIERGDVIVEFDGVHVRSSAELRRLIRETPAGRTVAVKVYRDGKAHNLSAELTASSNFHMPEVLVPPMKFDMPKIYIPPMHFEGFPGSPGAHHAMLGIAGDDLTPQLAQYFGVKSGTGVLISEVTKGGPADRAGLKAGDVIVQADGKPVRGVEELRSALNDNFTGDTRKVSLTLVRDHHEINVSVDLVQFRSDERHTSSNAPPINQEELARLKAQAERVRAQANQYRLAAERVRAEVQADVLRQNQFLNTEWQQELQQEMQKLHRELQHVKEFRFAMNQMGEI